MIVSNTSGYTIGIDVGSSGIRILLLNIRGNKINDQIVTYKTLEEQNHYIWDEKSRINLPNLTETIEDQLILLTNEYPHIQISSLSFSSIGPSLVLLSKQAKPLLHAFTYAFQGAQDYVSSLPIDYQKRTGSLHSSALPYVQLLKFKDDDILKSCFKITTINDYLTWNMTDLSLIDIFSSVPNASYTGLYSLEHAEWDKKLVEEIGLDRSILPKIVPLGTAYPIKTTFTQSNPFKNTYVVTGTIDGIDAFWATGVESEDIIVGSASSTGALRRLRRTPKVEYGSRLIQCCQIDDRTWVELIPFNNVGTSFSWLTNNFQETFKNYLTKYQLNIEKLEGELLRKLEERAGNLESFFLNLPLYFPYIEGEPRGPNGRGKIKGGFIFQKKSLSCVDLYFALLLGIVNMYKHNLEVLNPPAECQEIRLTGLIAQKSRLFLRFLASSVKKTIVIMKTEQSIAWATGMRALTYLNIRDKMPEISSLDSIRPENSEIQASLISLYKKYMEVYNAPTNYQIIQSEEEMNQLLN